MAARSTKKASPKKTKVVATKHLPTHCVRMPPLEMTAEDVAQWRQFVPMVELMDNPDPEKQTFFRIMHGQMLWRETQDSWWLLEGFADYVRAGLYPPPDMLRALAKGFDEWLNQSRPSKGRKGDSGKLVSLDKLLGLTATTGRDYKHEVRRREERDNMLTDDLVFLRALGATQDEAARMVSAKLKAMRDWNKSGWSLVAPEAGYLKKLFTSHQGVFDFVVPKYQIARNQPVPADRLASLATFPGPREVAPKFRSGERVRAIAARSNKT